MSNLLDKNDRAVRALIAAGVTAVNSELYVKVRNDPFARKVVDSKGNNIGLVEVDSKMGNEKPAGSGNYEVMVMVRVKFPAATQPNQGEEDNVIALRTLQNAVVDQLRQTDSNQDYYYTAKSISIAANALVGAGDAEQIAYNADMGAYSCLALMHETITGGNGRKDQQDLNFYEVCNFKMIANEVGGYWN